MRAGPLHLRMASRAPAPGRRPLGGGLAAVILAIAIAPAPAASAAPYLQAGVDADHAGVSSDPGPASPDLALTLSLPGSRAWQAFPLIHSGFVYVPVADASRIDGSFRYPNLQENGVYRIDLRTGNVTKFARLEPMVWSAAADERRLFVAHDGGVTAFDLATGAPSWPDPWMHPPLDGPLAATNCPPPAVRDGVLFVACTAIAWTEAAGFRFGTLSYVPFAAAVDAATGETLWYWRGDAVATSLPSPLVSLAPESGVSSALPFNGLSVVGPYVLLVGMSQPAFTGDVFVGLQSVHALDASTGTLLWSRNAPPDAEVVLRGSDGEERVVSRIRIPSTFPTGTSSIVYVKLSGDLLAINPGRDGGSEDAVLWRQPLGREDADDRDSGGSFAMTDEALFATSGETVYRFDPLTGAEVWRRTLAPGFKFGTSPLLVADGTLYARTSGTISDLAENDVHALDAESGEVLWSVALLDRTGDSRGRRFEFAVGEGVLVAAGMDGTVHVFGSSALAPLARAVPSGLYPAVGEPVVVNLTGTLPGLLGDATAFAATWGDGESTPWTGEGVLSHAYAAAGDVTAEFRARNSQGQTASVRVTFHVGASPPPSLNLLQVAFARENQDTTWGMIGLAVASAGGILGVARVRRRRRRLQRELAAVEAVHDTTKEDPRQCDLALRERKARARGLLVDGKLDEAQHAVLEKRIDDLSLDARMRAVDRRFDFLPHGMVRALQEVLADGRVTAWERQHYLAALDAERSLTEEQRSRVRSLLDEWFSEPGGPPPTPAATRAQPGEAPPP